MFFFRNNVTCSFRINHEKWKNRKRPLRFNDDQHFWGNVQSKDIFELWKTYQMDFEMFGYNPWKYLASLGLKEQSEGVKGLIEEHLNM